MRRLLFSPCALLILLGSALAVGRPPQAQASESLARQLPDGAVAVLETHRLGIVAAELVQSNFLQSYLEDLGLSGALESTEVKRAMAVKNIVESQFDKDALELLGDLLGDRLVVGVYPRPGSDQPGIVAVLRIEDPFVLKHLRDRLEPFVLLAGEQIHSETTGDTTTYQFGDDLGVAVNHEQVMFSNSKPLFERSLKLLRGHDGQSMADSERFQTYVQNSDASRLVNVFVDLAMIQQAAGGRAIPRKLDNPLASLLVGGFLEAAATSPYLGVHLQATDKQLALGFQLPVDAEKLPDVYRPFFSEQATPGTEAIPQPPGVIGGFVLFRDFATWYRNREDLLESEVLPGFDKFEAGLGNLLPGRDFGEDVLPLLGKQVTFVSAQQAYGHLAGKPGVQLPGFGAVVDLSDVEEGADLFRLFFQTLSAILNIQAGQQGRQPWVMTSENHHDVQISYGKYLQKPEGERLPLVFNFMPASAQVEDKFIVTSSVQLCRELVDWYREGEKDGSRENHNFELALDPVALSDILDANRQFLQAQTLQSGVSLEQAKQRVAVILSALKKFQLANISTSVKRDSLQLNAVVKWK